MPNATKEGEEQPHQENLDKKLEKLQKNLPLLHWGKIRFIGSLRIVSLVPFVGAAIIAVLRLPQFSKVNVKKLLEDVWTLRALIAFLVSLYSAHVIYYIFCPPMIRKFESLADLYREQLSIKKTQLDTYPSDNDKFNADLDHVTETYAFHLKKNALARWSSVSLFLFSLISLYYFLVKFKALLIDP